MQATVRLGCRTFKFAQTIFKAAEIKAFVILWMKKGPEALNGSFLSKPNHFPAERT